MNKKNFTEPVIDVVDFEEDVIATSGMFDPPLTTFENRKGISGDEFSINF